MHRTVAIWPFAFGLLPQGGESRSALPRRGTKSHLMLRSSRQVLLVVDEERQRRLLTNGSEDHSPGVLRLLWSAAESRRTCLRANLIRRPVPQGHGLAPCVMVFPLQVLSPFTFFEYGSRLAPMLGKTRSRLTTSCNECPLPVFSSIYFLRLWFSWSFFYLHDSNGVQIGSDARKKAAG